LLNYNNNHQKKQKNQIFSVYNKKSFETNVRRAISVKSKLKQKQKTPI